MAFLVEGQNQAQFVQTHKLYPGHRLNVPSLRDIRCLLWHACISRQSGSCNSWRQVGQNQFSTTQTPKRSHLPYLIIRINATILDGTKDKNGLVPSPLPKVGMLALCLQPTPEIASLHPQVETRPLQLANNCATVCLSKQNFTGLIYSIKTLPPQSTSWLRRELAIVF